ncbi:MAG: NfeD family protein [Synechococcales bacterium]|nr:NfeD family protein [Synechococcales bacterium]
MNLSVFPNDVSPVSTLEAGQVERTITLVQPGRVRFQGTYWPARFQSAGGQRIANPGDWVQIVGRQGITLLVEKFMGD